jgi:hypothetical protein
MQEKVHTRIYAFLDVLSCLAVAVAGDRQLIVKSLKVLEDRARMRSRAG